MAVVTSRISSWHQLANYLLRGSIALQITVSSLVLALGANSAATWVLLACNHQLSVACLSVCLIAK